MPQIGFLYDHILDKGGVENHLLTLIKNSDRSKWKFTLFSRTSEDFRKKISALEVKSIPVKVNKPLSIIAMRQLYQALSREKVDLLHIHGMVAATPGRIVAKLLRLPAVVTVHLPTIHYHGILQTPRARFGRFLYVQIDRILNFYASDALIFVSERIREEEINAGRAPRNSKYIPNGLALENYGHSSCTLRNIFGTPASCNVGLFAGRLEYRKGVDILVKSLQLLPSELPYFELWIAGSGPLEDGIRSSLNSLKKNITVRFLGYREDLPEVMSNANWFVFPSRNEAQPIVVMEALASGLPCIVTDVGDLPLMVENGVRGWVIPKEDPQLLASAMVNMILSPKVQQQMRLSALEYVKNFDAQMTTQQVLNVYETILSSRHS